MEKFIAIIQPDDGNISGVFARFNKKGGLVPVTYEKVNTTAFRRSYVYEADKAVNGVKQLMERLSRSCPGRIGSLWCGICSPSTELINASGGIVLSKYGRIVTRRDVEKSVKNASIIRLPLDRKIIYKAVSGYVIDGSDEVAEPFGMHAVKLDSSVNILTVKSSTVENLTKCIEEAGFLLDGFVYSPLGVYYGLLPEKFRKRNILLLDISYASSQLLQFDSGVLIEAKGFQTGRKALCDSQGEAVKKRLSGYFDEIASYVEDCGAETLLVSGELAVSEKFIDLLEERFTVPANPVFYSSFREQDILSVGPSAQLLKGFMEYLKDEFFSHSGNTHHFASLRANITNFINRYF